MSRRPAPSDEAIALGERIRVRRLAAGVTQRTLAKRLKLSIMQIINYEKGRAGIKPARLSQIAQSLGCDIRELVVGPPSL